MREGRRIVGAALIAGVALVAAAAAASARPLSGTAAPSAAVAAPPPATAASPGPDLPGTSSPRLSRARSSGSISAQQLRRRLQRLAGQAPSASGFLVRDLRRDGATLFARNAGARRALDSNTKLFTTATALHRLGGSGRIATRVQRQGALNRGRLKGSLYLIGAGDPTLSSAGMRALARQVRRSGIRAVQRGVVGDDSIFDRRRGVPASGWGPSRWIAPLSGLVHGGSTYGGDPARAAAAAFRSALRSRGVRVRGGIRVRGLPGKLRGRPPLARHASPTIAQIAASTNKPSNNFQAEMLLKRIWAQPGRQGTTRGGAGAVQRFARSLGSGIDARDGSGLTRGNAASPTEVAQLLAAMHSHPERQAFYRSLPVAGREGTLSKRMRGTPAAGRCRAKTGTISGVSTLSGYCDAAGGRNGRVAFSLLMGGVGSSQAARDIQDRMVVEIARYAG